MWFTDDVDVPDKVVQALSDNKLVIFVGAGASMGEPSNLPSFVDLARGIASDLNVPDAGACAPEEFLDRLEREERPVRANLVRRIGDPASQPNAMHTALVRLFSHVDTMRIVTTNYDQHLSTAAIETFDTEPPTYSGPAVPLGHDFSGIVYLHGAVDSRSRDLVVTTTDFGRAYLTDAWAARFLSDLFHQYVTLFVGYSHDDVVMRYLAQGLRPESLRFGFMPDTQDPEKWRPLGVHPITYPAGGDHRSLTETISIWGERIRMGQLDHEQRVRMALATDPPQTRADVAYLESVIANDHTAEIFARYATGTKWLDWITDRQPFPDLFVQGSILSEAGRELAVWFAGFATSYPNAALDVIQRHGATLNEFVTQCIFWELRANRRGGNDLGRWLAILIQNATTSIDRELGALFVDARWPEDAGAALMLFDHLVSHRLAVQPAFPGLVPTNPADDEPLGPGVPRFSVESLRGRDDDLRRAWDDYFKPHLDVLFTELAEILTKCLADAHRVLCGVGQANDEWDEQSFHRSAIAPEDQDTLPWPSYFLIDALRDCVEWLTQERPSDAASLIERLGLAKAPLLRRTALHGWTERTDISAEQKIQHLVDSGQLYAFAVKREVYRLIEMAASSAGPARRRLLEAALQGPPEEHALADNEVNEHLTLTLLSWIAEHIGNYPAARVALDRYQEEHPNLSPAEHPGYSHWSGPSGFGGSYPFPVEEVLECHTAAELNRLSEPSANVDAGAAVTWAFRAPEVIASAASQDLEWALGILSDLVVNSDWTSHFWKDILHGISRSVGDRTEDQLTSSLRLVADAISEAAFAAESAELLPPIAQLLMQIVSRRDLSTGVLERAEAIGAVISERFELGPDDSVNAEPEGILDRALNHWTGRIARFWISAIAHRRRLEDSTWTQLPEVARRSLERILEAASPYSTYPQAILAAYYPLVNDMDEAWATDHIYALFTWEADRSRAARAWSSFLSVAPWNERVAKALNRELREAFGKLDGKLGKSLAGRFAQLVVLTSSDIHRDGTLAAFVAKSDEEMRTEFARSVSWLLLHRTTSEYAENQWSHWIEHYLRDRLASLPLALSSAESGQMLGWIIAAGSHFPSAVEMYLGAEPAFAEFYGIFNEIRVRNIAQKYPEELARLLLFVLERSDRTHFFVCSDVGELLTALIPRVSASERTTLTAICEVAARLGCDDAMEWKTTVENQWPADD